ncbi:MAG: hypothetical protein US83_C0011G0003 [Candidatus Falkowbacteria bacterium GW2011_GWC2_38_22]|uniref:YcfA family protein n=1 Tax=Candidatus Falkowbacteria bacterium GW2011_GWE1_38_31 TaxID=1618638 RepID=A0A0G0K2W5_9BACT|nr:MAG: hypothetical protein US73_C0009G0003 [Candidatus Falkowbacteria bacterium GW2011_GWF2_38_1205]KKQ60885.1 MAG: hypothetical protein US83_C0011G0003 [Candidatus Falkowbacteria bacterium GW2011_GWC2_38_22]KKQ63003.1 MAG: hypothetical protein US84_C0009G0003 [Candidatus Falkowbacteria bacterium GW2011_GWF1_38_22]KKQ65025.1 MAG: hypothetical protein US87_C0009G0003 [Candidatus Falkowbacteria bacterium GW2011_GWE2_38_254]KKQ69800.1 MAG: hypothetical protein US91_C0009G0003 [Candidatus Falkowb
MRPITSKKLISILSANGYVLSRQKGSHVIFCHIETNTIVPVPLHGKNKPVSIGALLAIIKQSKISKDKFN